MVSEWKEYKFSEVIEINPQRNLKKGTIAPFIEMRAIEPNRRRPLKISRKMYSGGGAKFKNRDTLLARITPCLEHGKTVFISDLKEGEVGFGSTEFIVLTGKEGITAPLFVYYLCKYNEVRDFAIKSMTGSSGRQRVQEEAFNHLTIKVPPITEQRKIAEILGSLDDKIELNYEMNKTLEAIAQAIFKNWFVNFEPFKDELVYNEELGKEIPKDWKVGKLEDVLSEIESGYRPTGGVSNVKSGIPSIGAEHIMGLGKFDYSKIKYVPNDFFGKMERGKVRNGDVLLYKDGAYVGRKTYFDYNFPFDKCCVNEHVFILRTNELVTPKYLYFWLDQKWVTNILINMSLTSAQPGLNQQSLKTVPILIPEKQVVQRFDKTIEPFIALIFMNAKEARILEQIRDALLPKLLSGEIRVKVDVEEEFPEEAKKLEEIGKEKVKLQGSLEKWLK
jgi:type I restriction enzyme S subunit